MHAAARRRLGFACRVSVLRVHHDARLPEANAGAVWRRAANGAELVVNPMGRAERTLRLEVEAARPGRLEALAPDGSTVGAAELRAGRQAVELRVATDPDIATMITCMIAVSPSPTKEILSAKMPRSFDSILSSTLSEMSWEWAKVWRSM